MWWFYRSLPKSEMKMRGQWSKWAEERWVGADKRKRMRRKAKGAIGGWRGSLLEFNYGVKREGDG